jgi:hypothetical protein
MIPPVSFRTTLPRDEAWVLDDLAHQLGVRRSHVVRAMTRFIIQNYLDDFMTWMHDGGQGAEKAEEDPLPEGTEKT